MKISGIYKIINKSNGKYYVGSSENIEKRFRIHKQCLNGNYHINPHLQYAWNLYDKNIWNWMIIENVSADKLLIIEQKYLDIAKTEPEKTYNISFCSTAPMRGRNHSNESKLKMSNIHKTLEIHKNYKPTEETKLRQSVVMKGRYSGNKNPMFGRNRTKENNPMFGKTHSKDTIEKMKLSFVGKYKGDKTQCLENNIPKKLKN